VGGERRHCEATRKEYGPREEDFLNEEHVKSAIKNYMGSRRATVGRRQETSAEEKESPGGGIVWEDWACVIGCIGALPKKKTLSREEDDRRRHKRT